MVGVKFDWLIRLSAEWEWVHTRPPGPQHTGLSRRTDQTHAGEVAGSQGENQGG